VFYELLTRERPFAGEIATVLYKIVNEDPVAPSLINPAIPGGIDAVIRKALAKDPKDRFQSCEEMRQAFLEQSVRAPVTSPATVFADRVVAKRAPNAASAQRALELETATAPRMWPRVILGLAMLLIGAASWAFYVRSQTGVFPPLVATVETQVRALVAGTGKQETANAPATVSQVSAIPAASTVAAMPNAQPAAAQPASDHPTGESAAVGGATAASAPAETSQKSVDPSQTDSTPTIEPSERHQTADDHTNGHDSLAASSASREEDKQNTAPATLKPSGQKRAPEAASSVEGFSRQDIPDLLRQADSYTARGDYRLARYEYGLVLKLDHNNVQAREGLRRLLAAWQSR